MKGLIIAIITLLGCLSNTYGQTLELPETDFPESMASGKLPLISILTEDFQPIVSKDSTLNAKLTLKVPEGYVTFQGDSAATDLADIDLTIRGRGNASWKGLIKPYKIKFTKKQEILGLPAQKHFALLPFAGYLNEMSGFGGLEIARLFDWWVPKVEPIELAINGEYRGKYYLTESIKINKNRLDIFEQPDSCTDPDIIPFGWLIEIDNHPDSASSIPLMETPKMPLNVTYHVPELLSDPQRQWLTDEITKINAAIYRYDDSWVEYFDPVSAARYFIVRELLWDPDGYAGSMYLHRDRGLWNEPWRFGPMWDIASGHKPKYSWVHESNHHFGVHWFPALLKSEVFLEVVRQQFSILVERREDIRQIMNRIYNYCSPAHRSHYRRWGYPAVSETMDGYNYYYIRLLFGNLDWMTEALDERPVSVGIDEVCAKSELRIVGRTVRLSPLAAGALPITLYAPDGSEVKSFTLAPGESRSLDRRGIFILTSPGRQPRKIRL